MAKVKAVFYLPLVDNDGQELADDIGRLEIELYLRFVGWTFLGYVKGAFQMRDGSQSLDESAAYSIVLEERRVDELEALLLGFKQQTKQEAIYLEIQRDIDV
jgi:hypothetical protein